MNILQVSEDVPFPSMGGLAKHAIVLSRALNRAGHQVDFMGNADHFFNPEEPELALPGRFFPELTGTQRGWKERSLGCFMPFKRDFIARGIARAILARSLDYDVVHYHGHYPNVGAFIPAEVNFVQTRHDLGSDCLTHTRFRNNMICMALDPQECATCATARPNRVQQAISTAAVSAYRRKVAVAFRRHKTVFVSAMLARNFERTAGQGPWGSVVHNFIDLAPVKRAANSPSRLMGLTDAAQCIAFAGKLSTPKGIEPLLELAVPRLSPNSYLLIIGDGPLKGHLHKCYSNERVIFFGWCDGKKTLKHLGGADIVVVPSVWEEPCATIILEGLALGKPTYALTRGGTPELKDYEIFPGQLRLFDSMADLVNDLVSVVGTRPLPVRKKAFRRGVDEAALELINIYLAAFPTD